MMEVLKMTFVLQLLALKSLMPPVDSNHYSSSSSSTADTNGNSSHNNNSNHNNNSSNNHSNNNHSTHNNNNNNSSNNNNNNNNNNQSANNTHHRNTPNNSHRMLLLSRPPIPKMRLYPSDDGRMPTQPTMTTMTTTTTTNNTSELLMYPTVDTSVYLGRYSYRKAAKHRHHEPLPEANNNNNNSIYRINNNKKANAGVHNNERAGKVVISVIGEENKRLSSRRRSDNEQEEEEEEEEEDDEDDEDGGTDDDGITTNANDNIAIMYTASGSELLPNVYKDFLPSSPNIEQGKQHLHQTSYQHKHHHQHQYQHHHHQHRTADSGGSGVSGVVGVGGSPLIVVNHQQVSTCQTVCACKWKGGKQTVECIDRLLLKIPDNIDPSTQVLDMSGNKLHTLLNEQFLRANLLNLQKLYLRSCKIVDIENQTFKGLTNLVELDLSHNMLSGVPSMALSYISSLRDLTLSSNRIPRIERQAFINTPALHKLDLSHCDIQVIAPQAFTGLKVLTLLRLNGNKLSELVPTTIQTLRRLHGIELHDNPWMCDCRMRMAKIWLTENNIPYPVAPVCAGGPERVIDQTFSDLSVNDFACKPEMLPAKHYVETTMGENASILCRVKAIPEPMISWYWSGRFLANNSAFSSHQRLQIFEKGSFEKTSKLVLTNAQEIDSSDFYCSAENRAGAVEANFTLLVKVRAAGMASLGSGQIVGLSAALVVLIVFVLVFVAILLLRVRREPYHESKTPNHLEVITSINNQNAIIMNKTQTLPMNGTAPMSNTPNRMEARVLHDAPLTLADDNHDADNASIQSTNPLQKPPRLLDMSYTTTTTAATTANLSLEKNPENGVLGSGGSCFVSPTTSTTNNPDLINDTQHFGSDELTELKASATLAKNLIAELVSITSNGDYKRAGGCDSLYPSGLWQDTACASSADDLYLRRYTDTTPIMETQRLYDLLPDKETTTENFSKTFPRTNFSHSPQPNESSSSKMNASSSIISARLLQQQQVCSGSTASTTTTNLSTNSGSGSGSGVLMGGYPNDYGLPLVPGAELIQQHSPCPPTYPQMHALHNKPSASNFGAHRSPAAINIYNRLPTSTAAADSSTSGAAATPFVSRTLPRQKSVNAVSNENSTTSSRSPPGHPKHINPSGLAYTGSPLHGSLMAPLSAPTQNLNAKTIRVWQKGGVPVLPPVTALKRALTSNSRNSPDEGYQEGCGTDV